MQNKLLFVAALFFLSTVAEAQDFKKSKAPPAPNLIEESQALTVLKEQTIQNEKDDSRHLYGVQISQLSANRLNVFANEKMTVYRNISERQAIGVKLGYLPLHFASGYLGLLSSIHYSYFENRGANPTALHWVSANMNLAYRYEPRRNSWFKPYVAVGSGVHTVIQRGVSQSNTSEAHGTANAILGTAVNMNRLFADRSPLLWEFVFEFKRVTDPSAGNLDFNGDHLSVGMELAL